MIKKLTGYFTVLEDNDKTQALIREQESFREGLLCILSSSEYVMLPSNSRAKYRRLRQFVTETKK